MAGGIGGHLITYSSVSLYGLNALSRSRGKSTPFFEIEAKSRGTSRER
jgi:hypothetical protein